MTIHLHLHFSGPITVNADLIGVLSTLKQLKEFVMSSQQEIAASLNALTEQVAKIGAESAATLQKVADLEVILNQQSDVSPELQAAFDALKAQVQVVDDLVPDAPAA